MLDVRLQEQGEALEMLNFSAWKNYQQSLFNATLKFYEHLFECLLLDYQAFRMDELPVSALQEESQTGV